MSGASSLTDAFAWVPDELSIVDVDAGPVSKASTALVPLERERDIVGIGIETVIDLDRPHEFSADTQTIATVISLRTVTAEWLTKQVRMAMTGALSIRDVVHEGRNLDIDTVTKERAVHKGVHLRQDLRWHGPSIPITTQITKLADTQRRLLASHGDEADALRTRVHLQTVDLANTVIAYAATELIDPKVLETPLTLDVMVHSSQLMSADVILSLGLSRAYLDEAAIIDETDELWPTVREAWFRNMADVEVIANRWAMKVLESGRAADMLFLHWRN